MLTTTPECVWVLQALCGVEQMPTMLHLKPFIPSVHDDLVVDTDQGRRPLSATEQYASLVTAGVIDARGEVDVAVRDWMTVLGRAEREAVLTIRRPDQPATDEAGATVAERTMVVCRYRRHLAMAARNGEEIVIGGVGESADAHQQVELMCQMLIPAFGDHPPADIDGINLPKDLINTTVEQAGADPAALEEGLRRAGLGPWEIEVISAAANLEQSAMAVVAVVDRCPEPRAHPQVLSVADTEYGRLTFSNSRGADGKEWMSIWPTTPVSLHRDLAGLLSRPALV
jgi:hypothetical protein